MQEGSVRPVQVGQPSSKLLPVILPAGTGRDIFHKKEGEASFLIPSAAQGLRDRKGSYAAKGRKSCELRPEHGFPGKGVGFHKKDGSVCQGKAAGVVYVSAENSFFGQDPGPGPPQGFQGRRKRRKERLFIHGVPICMSERYIASCPPFGKEVLTVL